MLFKKSILYLKYNIDYLYCKQKYEVMTGDTFRLTFRMIKRKKAKNKIKQYLTIYIKEYTLIMREDRMYQFHQ